MKELLGVYKRGMQASASWKPRRTVSITIQVTIFCKPLEKKNVVSQFSSNQNNIENENLVLKNIHRHITEYFQYYK
jgi:hypothetical protein